MVQLQAMLEQMLEIYEDLVCAVVISASEQATLK